VIKKLAVLYTLLNNYVVHLRKEHILQLLQLIQDTDIGEMLLNMYSILIKTSTVKWKTAFMITSRDNSIVVIVAVENNMCFLPYMKEIEKTRAALKTGGIDLELTTEAEFSKTDLLPF
jgi:hypothetical protein